MQLTRKTALAAASMTVVTLISATFAVVGIMDLPVFGFGAGDAAVLTTDATEDDASPSSTDGDAAEIVEQVVYEDVYERPSRPTPASTVAAAGEPVVPSSSVAPATSTTTTRTSTTATAPTTTRRVTTTVAVTSTRQVTSTRPAPPPGCIEPEWDGEHQRWHCKGD